MLVANIKIEKPLKYQRRLGLSTYLVKNPKTGCLSTCLCSKDQAQTKPQKMARGLKFRILETREIIHVLSRQ